MPLCDQWHLKSENVVACHTNVHEVYWIHCTMCLVATTVAEITARCTTKIIHIEGSAVPHFDVSGPFTAVVMAETHLPGNLAIRHWRVATIQPAGCRSATPAPGRTCGCHPWPCCSFKSEPAGTKVMVTLPVNVISVRLLAVSAAETSVVLTFWKTQKVNNKTKWINYLIGKRALPSDLWYC